ncbi:aminotransferase class III-fold pyridoxal phosphate-dependent enzyme [Kribbella speibonae]|uniref:Aminotransferase class III-fold pyridoxal phosphate-dependent enzyme n=1 Tax=Kribbella speibonae TaxID=1572660 RepID=A0ABY2AC71_9ACTN|nr:aminotransferase class III-fold pyridoxal phosphate-dependent enzyme [Kribbella speibonae]
MEKPVQTRRHDHADRLYARARQVIAGGVSSDARRADRPLFVDHASGAELWDVDGNRYLDYVLGQGPNLLGHAAPLVADAVSDQVRRGVAYAAQHELEAQVAERLCSMVPAAELVRFNSVGSEAVHGAIRLARGHTGRPKIVKFEGNYHGWLDPVLYSVHPDLALAGDARHPTAVGGTAGQPRHDADDLIVLPYNDLQAVEEIMADDIAAVILEPLLCNTGCITPAPGYLEGLRELTQQHGSLLIFDEIITGFRVAPGGAGELLGVVPDLAAFGKAMAGGMQVSALVGSAEVMGTIADGKVAHAGTFNSHPVGMAAADAVLRHLDEHRADVYPALNAAGKRLMDGLRAAAAKHGVPLLVDGPGPVFQTYITDQDAVTDYRTFAACDRAAMARFHAGLFAAGTSIVPRGLWFLSTEHTEDQIDETIAVAESVLSSL